MASIKQVEDAIFNREGFRVKLTPLNEKTGSLPAYDYEYMCSNKWKLTEWRMSRLARYIPYLRSADILRPDGSRTVSDLRIGNLRDAYFNECCRDEIEALATRGGESEEPKVTQIAKAPSKRKGPSHNGATRKKKS